MDQVTTILFLTFSQICQLLGILFFFGFLLKWLGERTLRNFTYGHMFFNIISLIGTPVHEFGHFIMCKIFRYDVEKVVWYQKPTSEGTLGFVHFSYNPNSIYQRIGKFFVGIGPLFSGPLCIFLLLYVLLPDTFHLMRDKISDLPTIWQLDTLQQLFFLAGSFFFSVFSVSHVLSWQLYVFLLLSCAIAVHIRLSRSDLKSATSGIFTLIVVFFFLNGLSVFFKLTISTNITYALSMFNAYFIAVMMIASLISILFFMFSFIWGTMKNRAFH